MAKLTVIEVRVVVEDIALPAADEIAKLALAEVAGALAQAGKAHAVFEAQARPANRNECIAATPRKIHLHIGDSEGNVGACGYFAPESRLRPAGQEQEVTCKLCQRLIREAAS